MPVIRGAAFGCSHSPFTSPSSMKWVLDTLADAGRLHMVAHLGDLFESGAASVHPNEYTHSLLDEYSHGAWFLDQIEAVVGPRCKKVWVLGNHDDNLQAQDPRRVPPALRSAVHWNNSPFSKTFRRWTQVPYVKAKEGTLRVGDVVLTHGWDSSPSSGELEAIQVAGMHGFEPGLLVVRAHTHVPIAPTRCMRSRNTPLPWWFANVGTLGPLKPNWTSRVYTGMWGAGVLIFETEIDPSPTISGRRWTAELLTLEGEYGGRAGKGRRR
jgi:hypothetical protein